MMAHGGSSGLDEPETAYGTASATGTRLQEPAAGQPGTSAGRRHHFDLGPVRLSLLSPPASPAVVELEARCATSAPRTWHLVFATRGPLVVDRDERLVRLDSGTVMLREPSLCVRLSAETAGPPVRALVLHLPEAALPLPGAVLHDVSGRPAPTRSGPAALLSSFVQGLAAHVPSVDARHTAWWGTAAVSLATAFLDSETAFLHGETDRHPSEPVRPSPAAVPSGPDLLLREIKAYVADHLRDADLSPASIAAANHISLRYLHHLFQRDGLTVGTFLRESRLEHCRADLADPSQAQRSAREIARRWGFSDAAVFNRTFKSAYGVTPGTYRRQRLQR
jgi:AraC-like DNA-binding protein